MNPRFNGRPSDWTQTCDLTEELDADATITLPPPGRKTAGPAAKPSSRPVNVLCDRYLLGRQLGCGGTAVVSSARDLWRPESAGANPLVAIKQLRPELRGRPCFIARLQREFRQTRALAHPDIVRVFDLHCDRGTWFIAMELLRGEPLGQRLRRAEPRGLPAHEAMRIGAACADVLAFSHERGVTHGDVKPDNVMLTTDKRLRVVDFGSAAEADEPPMTADPQEGLVSVVTTPAYASPEVLSGLNPEPRDDIFSLSCFIYEMLAGRHPFGRRDALEAMDRGLRIRPWAGFARRQWLALTAGLAWRREQRPADARELMQSL